MPACAMPVLTMLRPAVSTPPSHRCCLLVRAAVRTTGRRTVTNFLRTGRGKTPGPMSADQRVCSPRRWSLGGWRAGCSRACWTMSSHRAQCSWQATLRSLSLPGLACVTRDGSVMAGARPTGIRPSAGGIQGSSCRGSSSGRSPLGPGPSRWSWPCPVPQRGLGCTGDVSRPRCTWPGCCWRAWYAGVRRTTAGVWATAAMAPARPHGVAAQTAVTSRG